VVEMQKEKTFGSYIKEKRLEKGVTLRQFAAKINISPVHMSNLENNRRAAPKEDVLERIAFELLLSKEDQLVMHDLAAKSKNIPSVSSDLPDYIMENDIVRAALRTAKDVDATDEEWLEFIEKLGKRSKNIKEES
jgi:transcriptional regulator with XRE-family HTH domain